MTAFRLGNACELRDNGGDINGPAGVSAPTGPDPDDLTTGAVAMIVAPCTDTIREAR
jgi:hypothetical protein